MASTAFGSPAYAAGPVADLAVSLDSTYLETYYYVVVRTSNKGPEDSDYDVIKAEIKAPKGMVFGPRLERELNGFGYFNCTTNTPHQHIRCTLTGSMWVIRCEPNTDCTPYHRRTFEFVQKQKCTGPGHFTLTYAHDPNSANNSVTLPGPKNPSSCTAKPAPSKAVATPTTTPTATPPPPAPSWTPSSSPTLAETSLTAPAAPVVPDNGGMVTRVMIVGGGSLLLGLGGAIWWWLARRRRPQGTDPA